jgi:hypothetical protein
VPERIASEAGPLAAACRLVQFTRTLSSPIPSRTSVIFFGNWKRCYAIDHGNEDTP